MTYQQLWCYVHWPEYKVTAQEAEATFHYFWTCTEQRHETEGAARDHWKNVMDVIQIVLKETEGEDAESPHCPKCREEMVRDGGRWVCSSGTCGLELPRIPCDAE